ncbi:transcriptional regulator, MarR family [Actinobacteria bacterium OK074]|nr:transcriptional regulator, MarR family [Actinobacteria bacterium OK074]
MATHPRTLAPEEWELWEVWMLAQRLLARELERGLQRDAGISKAEFSVLMTLWRAPGGEMRVAELTESLAWEKSRLSHQLTRMENRGLVERTQSGAAGRRTRIGLTPKGHDTTENAILGHGDNIRRHFLDTLTPEQAAAIRAWSDQMVGRMGAGDGEGEAEGSEAAR